MFTEYKPEAVNILPEAKGKGYCGHNKQTDIIKGIRIDKLIEKIHVSFSSIIFGSCLRAHITLLLRQLIRIAHRTY